MLYVVLILVVMFVEYYMSIRWFPIYYNFGIPIYSKRLIGKKSILSEIDDDYLNITSKSFALMFVTPLIFKKITAGQWALRQKSFRTATMHGNLFIEQETSNLRLVGFINWWILFLIGVAIQISLQHKEFFIIVFIAIMGLLFYFLEKHMCDKLVNYLSEKEL